MKVPTNEDFNKYTGLHCHQLWADVGEHWICPSCQRSKFEILRWTKRFPGKQYAFMDWVAILHRHHDHSQDYNSLNARRFPQTIVCDQCNSADGVVKRKLKLPKSFSFSPEEISLFVSATPHGKHKINYEMALAIYTALNLEQN